MPPQRFDPLVLLLTSRRGRLLARFLSKGAALLHQGVYYDSCAPCETDVLSPSAISGWSVYAPRPERKMRLLKSHVASACVRPVELRNAITCLRVTITPSFSTNSRTRAWRCAGLRPQSEPSVVFKLTILCLRYTFTDKSELSWVVSIGKSTTRGSPFFRCGFANSIGSGNLSLASPTPVTVTFKETFALL